MAKAPDPTAARREAEAKAAREQAEAARERAAAKNLFRIIVHVDDASYDFCAGDVVPAHVRALRRATESTFVEPETDMLLYFRPGQVAVPLDKTAELIFMARLQGEDQVSLEEIEAGLSARQTIWFEFPAGEDIPSDDEVFVDPLSSGGS